MEENNKNIHSLLIYIAKQEIFVGTVYRKCVMKDEKYNDWTGIPEATEFPKKPYSFSKL